MPRKNRPNAGWFRRGYDPRRHKLTAEERRRGGERTVRLHYFGGDYARYLGQGRPDGMDSLAELAQLGGDGDRPGERRGRGARN